MSDKMRNSACIIECASLKDNEWQLTLPGPVNAILSWNGLIPLSRLTYSAYLIHPALLYLYFYSRKATIYMDDMGLVFLYLGVLCVTYGAAFVLSLAFESPMMALEKVLLGPKKHS